MKKYELFSEDETFEGPRIWEEKALFAFLKELENLGADHICFANSMNSYEKPESVKVDWDKKTVFLSGSGGLDIGAAFGWHLYEEEKIVTEYNGLDGLSWRCDEYVSIELK